MAALINSPTMEALGELFFGLLVGDDFGSGAVVLCIDGIDTSCTAARCSSVRDWNRAFLYSLGSPGLACWPG